MKNLNNEKTLAPYPAAKLPLLHDDQLATLISLLCSLEAGVCAIEVIERLHTLESEKHTKAVWRDAADDLKKGTLNEVLVKTRLFGEDIQTILLLVQDPIVALNAVNKYLKTRYNGWILTPQF